MSASRDIFDGRMLDLFAEIFVVDKLSREGFSQFQPIPRDNKATPDYECVFVDDEGKQQGACLEIKNCRAPVGIMEVLKRELRDRNDEDRSRKLHRLADSRAITRI